MAENNSSDPAMPFHGFLSFRGSDIRDGLSKEIRSALKEAGCTAFYDEAVGDVINQKIEEGIRNSNIHIVLLSENYADSQSCVEELELIMKHSSGGSTVIPVFIGVDPSDVKNLTKKFGTGFKIFLKRYKKEDVKIWTEPRHAEWRKSVIGDKEGRWRKAFEGVAGVKRLVSVKPDEEEELVKKIVAEFVRIKDEQRLQSRRVNPPWHDGVILIGSVFIFMQLLPLLQKTDFYNLIVAACVLYTIFYVLKSSYGELQQRRG